MSIEQGASEYSPQTQELLRQFTSMIEANPNRFLFNPIDAREAQMTLPDSFRYTLGDLCLGPIGTEFGSGGADTLRRLTATQPKDSFVPVWDQLVGDKDAKRQQQFIDAIKQAKELRTYLQSVIEALTKLVSQYEKKWQEKVAANDSKRKAAESGTGSAPTRADTEEAIDLDRTLGIIKEDLQRLQTEEFKRGLQILELVVIKADEYRQSKGWGMGASGDEAPAPQPVSEKPEEHVAE